MKKKRIKALLLASVLSLSNVITSLAIGGGDGAGNGGTQSWSGSATENTTRDFGVGGVIYLSHFGQFFDHTGGNISIEQLQNGAQFSRVLTVGNFQGIYPRLKEASIFYTPANIGDNFQYWNPVRGAYVLPDRVNVPLTPLEETYSLNTSTTFLASGTEWAQDAVRKYGDAGGKLESLLAALRTAQSNVASSGGSSGDSPGGSFGSGSDVSVDASALTAEDRIIMSLGTSEVKAQLKHYLDWWVDVYNQLGTVEAGVKTPEEVRAQFSQVMDYASNYRPGGPGATRISALDDYVAMSPEVMNYPCMGINYMVFRRHNTSFYRAMTWDAVWNFASSTAIQYGRLSLGWGNGTLENIITSPGYGQKCLRSPSLMFTNDVIYGGNNLGNQPSAGRDQNAGYQFFGYYGALVTGSVDTPVTPPPDNPPPPDIPTPTSADDIGTYYLMDYEMNHIFDSMAEHYQDSTSHDHARLNTGICTTDPSDYSDCDHGNNDYNTTEYYDVHYTEDAGSGPSVTMDNAGPTKLFLHNNGTKGNTWWTRDEIRGGQVVNSNSVSDYVIDYGFNLVRKNFDDARAYSKIIAQSVDKNYLEQTLGMYEGIITNNPKKVTPLRDSTAVVGPVTGIQDNLAWNAYYEKTGSQTKFETYDNSHTYYCGSDDCSGHTCNYQSSRSAGQIQAFSVHGVTPSAYSVALYSIAHKYQTTTIPTGYAQPKDREPFDYRPTTNGDGNDDDNQYRGSNTIDPGTEVTYVPEVPMLVDEVPGPELTHQPKKVITVGEESRKSKLILMTLYRVTGASTPVKGVVYSDTAVGGDAGLSSQTNSRLLALTAGGDFTVKADTNMQVNLYGYALDLIEPGDAGYDTVTLGNDVKAGWGNSGSRNKLMETYQTWAAAMLNPKNYQADFEMTIGSKKYNSFSATVGSFSSKASQSTETDQYNIHVKHGKVQEDAGYNAFIAQLASDYGCSEGEAKTLFANSDMASAIIKAIEHDDSSLNKSLPARYALAPGETGTFNEPDLATQVGGIGNANHWYDEEVRVFVIRRFMTPAARINNIIAQDKMDIGTSMESLGNDKIGSFKLNVWFRDVCYTREIYEYIPNTEGDNKTQAIAAGDLIIAGVDVTGADFNITNATTATGKH